MSEQNNIDTVRTKIGCFDSSGWCEVECTAGTSKLHISFGDTARTGFALTKDQAKELAVWIINNL